MNLSTWLKMERGRSASLAVRLGIKPPQVADWVSGDRQIPIAHMAAIEVYSGGEVTRQEMCPDRWQDIWPELIPCMPVAHENQAQPATECVAVALGEGV